MPTPRSRFYDALKALRHSGDRSASLQHRRARAFPPPLLCLARPRPASSRASARRAMCCAVDAVAAQSSAAKGKKSNELQETRPKRQARRFDAAADPRAGRAPARDRPDRDRGRAQRRAHPRRRSSGAAAAAPAPAAAHRRRAAAAARRARLQRPAAGRGALADGRHRLSAARTRRRAFVKVGDRSSRKARRSSSSRR